MTSYENAYQELQAILAAIQAGQVSIDKLAEKTKRAAELIAFCKEKLRTTETEINALFDS